MACPGVAEDPGIQFEDETGAVIEQMQRKQAKQNHHGQYAQHEVLFVPSAPKFDIRKAAVCFFFRNYVSPGCNFEISRGFLANLDPLYRTQPPGSAICLATSALSITFLGGWYGHGFDTPLGQVYLGRALSALAKSLADPEECLSDETLVAVMLLRMLDHICSRAQVRKASPEHLNGAFALIKHRREVNFKTERSCRLLQTVRHSRILSALEGKEFIEPDPEAWDDQTPIPDDTAPDLDSMAIEVVNLQASFALWKTTRLSQKVSKQTCNSASHDAEVFHNFLRTALDLDAQLAGWADSQSPEMRPMTVSGSACIPNSVAEAGLFGDSCDIYSSFMASNIWSTYRRFHLVVLAIILQCERALLNSISAESLANAPNVQRTGRTMRKLIDGVCASIPFYLGNRTRVASIDEFMNLDKVVFPISPEEALANNSRKDLSSSPKSRYILAKDERTRFSVAMSGWHLIEPFAQLIELLSSDDGPLVETFLREGQKEWICEQLRRLHKLQRVGNFSQMPSISSGESLTSKINAREAFYKIGG